MIVSRLSSLEAISGAAAKPGYEPADHGAGIVHIGIGAFHRAHQAVVTDDALAAQGGDWRIVGVSLRSRDIADKLNAQNGLYALVERGAGLTSARVVGSIAKVIAADPAATLAALCDPDIRIVTLTVTEKGYGIDRLTRAPDLTHPAVAADLADPHRPVGVLGLLCAAAARRRATGALPLTVLSCDNLPENGALLRDGVVGFARRVDAELATWIGANMAFPSSMVDRITPASTEETVAEARRQTGCEDMAAVESEPFLQWVIEDIFPHGRPEWEAGGALLVDHVEPYERMKLTMLNGSHSMLAYSGFLSGHRYVRDVMDNPQLAALVEFHLGAAAAVLPDLQGIDLKDYAAALAMRFRNPAIAHETYQIAMDGTQKLPQRIFQPALLALEAGQEIRPFAFATAMWMRYCIGRTDDGIAYALRDPREAEIANLLAPVLAASPASATSISDTLHGLPSFIPKALSENEAWRTAIAEILETALTQGVKASIAHEAGRLRP